MNPAFIHRICAQPQAISCAIGAALLNAFLLLRTWDGVKVISAASDLKTIPFLLIAIIAASGLGSIFGMFTFFGVIRALCSRMNGAPFHAGDSVLVLRGPLRGKLARVEEIGKGQGGWPVLYLSLHRDPSRQFTNIFEEFEVLKLPQPMSI